MPRSRPASGPSGRRRGSPWTGMGAVIAKEAADHLGGARMLVVEALMFLIALAAAWFAATAIRTNIGESPYLFLHLLIVTPETVPLPVASIIGLVTPVIAIALGFDAINGEFSQRTFSRLLAQPIYRDALLLGKFLARLLVLAIALLSLWLLVLGLGVLRFGLPPSFEEVVRMLGFLAAAVAYGGVWLAIALLFSVLFRGPATAALASLGLWLLFTFFWSLIVTRLFARLIAGSPEDVGGFISYIQTLHTFERLSPNTLFSEVGAGLLIPSTHGFGLFSQLNERLQGTLPTPLSTGQSFILVWPQLTGLVAATIVIFVIAYIAFQRQEIRA